MDPARAVVLSIIVSLVAFLVLVAGFTIGLSGAAWGGYLCYASGALSLVGAGLGVRAAAMGAAGPRAELILSAGYATLMNAAVLAGSVAVALDLAGVL